MNEATNEAIHRPEPKMRPRWLQFGSEIDADELLSLILSVAGLVLSISIGHGFFQTGSWPRDITVAIYSLTADVCVGTLLSSLYGIISVFAQRGIPVNYELLTILSSLRPRTSYRFSELSVKKLLIFSTITILTFGPDQLVNFALPQEREVVLDRPREKDIRLAAIGGGFTTLENDDVIYDYSTTGLKFMSETVLSVPEKDRISKKIGDRLQYFLPLQPDVLYNGQSFVSNHSSFISVVSVPQNFGIFMNVTTGSNSCDMEAATSAENAGAEFMTAATRNDEFSVTVCSCYKPNRGSVLKADFQLFNRSALVEYKSDGFTSRIESVDDLSAPLPLMMADQIDLVRHNMTDCFLNMILYVNRISEEKGLSAVGIGLVIRAANSSNGYGFHGGRGLPRQAQVQMGTLVYGGTGLVFWSVIFLFSLTFLGSIVLFFMNPVMSGETRQNNAVYSKVATNLPDSHSTFQNRKRSEHRRIPDVVIGYEKVSEDYKGTALLICSHLLRTTVVEGQNRERLHLVAGSLEDVVPFEEITKKLEEEKEHPLVDFW